MSDDREFTVGELATEMLKLAPQGAKVLLRDYDSGDLLPDFNIYYNAENKELVISPCGK